MQKIITSFLTFVLVFLVFSPAQASAKVIGGENEIVTIAKTEIINDDLFIGAQTAEINGTVNGDVFVGAQTVIIAGTLNGNLHVVTGTLDLKGKVSGNVYAGAQSILVNSANIGGSLLVGAATVNIDKTTVIGGSVMAGTATLSLDSQVGRNVYAGTSSLMIGSNAKIGKDLYYAVDKDQTGSGISPEAKIVGETHKSEISTPKRADAEAFKKQLPSVFKGIKIGATIVSLVGALIVGFLYLKLSGKHLTETAGLVSGSFWKSLGVGFLVTIAIIPGLIILLMTVVGIPLAGLSLLMIFLFMCLSKFVVSLPLGSWIAKKTNLKTSTYGAIVLGLVALSLLNFVPYIGFLAGLVVIWAGLGALTQKLFSKTA